MAKLEAYLGSPYFETKSPVLVLFQYLNKLHPQFEEKKMDAAYMQKKVPALGDQRKQANYGSELLNATEHFLAVEDFQANTDSLNRHRLQAYKKHHLFEQFNKEHEQLLKELDKNTEQDIDTFYQRHILTELALNGFNTKLNRTITNDIHPVTETLDVFYALKKLRYHCELLNRKQILGTPSYEENLPYLLKILEPYKNDKHPYILLTISAYEILKATSYEEMQVPYEIIKKYITDYKKETLPNSIIEIILYAKNLCLYWYSKGNPKAGAESLWWIELSIKYGFFTERNKLQPVTFRNAVALAIHNNKEKEWIRSFIKTWAPHLPQEQYETHLSFAEAQYFYYIGNYDKAMPMFQQALTKEEPIFNAIVRRWQFMCLYEQNSSNTDLLFDFLDAYEKYILRYSESLHWFKDTFTKNILFSRKLLKANDMKTRKAVAELLKTENYFTGKEWLLKQL